MKKYTIILLALVTMFLLSAFAPLDPVPYTFSPVCENPEGHPAAGTVKVRITGPDGNYRAVRVSSEEAVDFTITNGEVKKNFPGYGDWVVYWVDVAPSPIVGTFTIPLNLPLCSFPSSKTVAPEIEFVWLPKPLSGTR